MYPPVALNQYTCENINIFGYLGGGGEGFNNQTGPKMSSQWRRMYNKGKPVFNIHVWAKMYIYIFGYLKGPGGGGGAFNDHTGLILPSSYPLTHIYVLGALTSNQGLPNLQGSKTSSQTRQM